jgi:photosystem II stability/assembly factor-like uncharacterized protein
LGDSLFYVAGGFTTTGVGTTEKLAFSQIDGTCYGSVPVACNYTWATQVSGTTSLLQSVDAVSPTVAWAAGAAATVRRTTDGGLTWTNANPNPGVIVGDIYNISAVDANIAFVTTSASSTFIYRTTNGGQNWTQVFSQAGGFIDAIEMVNATTGYALGDPVGSIWTVLQTTNGGLNWTQMPGAPAQVGTEAGWNNSFQVLGSNMWFGTSNSKIYYSTNGGLNWASGPTTGMSSSYTLRYNSPTTGLGGGGTTNYIMRSTNGGATYTTVASLPTGTGNITGMSGLLGTTEYWVIRGNNVHRSTNNGDNWTQSYTGTAALWDIDIVEGTPCPTGWAVGASGTIVKMTGIPVGISGNNNNVPSDYKLEQNYPNPFNPSTTISFSIPNAGNVTLEVYDISGKLVKTLVNDFRQAGSHSVTMNASELASGVYMYKLISGSFTETKKMVLVK